MSDSLAGLLCAGCNAAGLVDQGDGTVQCQYCGASFAHPDRVCPDCETVSDLDELDCPQCGRALRGLCPACNAPNPLQAKICLRCHTPLDLLASVAGRVATTSSDFIYQRGIEARTIKQHEETASDERLARMWARDQERDRRLQAARAKQKQQELVLARVAVGLLVVIVVGGALLFLVLQVIR